MDPLDYTTTVFDAVILTGLPRTAEGSLQLLHRPFLLLQFLHQRVHGLFRPLLLLVPLFPAEQALHRRAGEGEQGRDGGRGVHYEMGKWAAR